MLRIVSLLVSLMKWPIALASAALAPAAALTFWDLITDAYAVSFWKSPFAIGFVCMFVFMVLFHRWRFVQFWATMEHELTHALFAWLTFIPVRELRTSDGSSVEEGEQRVGVVFLEGDNWLINVSPYFFPTAAAAVLGATWILAEVPTTTASVLTGCATAWCVVSTWHETHAEQSDFKSAGFGFSFLFLPGANILCYGMLLANELGGPDRAWEYATSVPQITMDWVRHWI